MIKYIGIMLISGALSMYGAFAAARIRTRAAQRKGLIGLLHSIKSGIEFGGAPLEEIYGVFECSALEKSGFCEILRRGSPDSFENAMQCPGLRLGEKEYALFCEYAAKCGKSSSIQNEKQLCERYISLAQNLDDGLCREENSKCALYTRLGVLAGLTAALILL